MLTASELITKKYRELITLNHPELCYSWPILAGYNIINGEYDNHIICIFKHTGAAGMVYSSVADFNGILNGTKIFPSNIEYIRNKIRTIYNLNQMDSIVILRKDAINLDDELNKLYMEHKIIMGLEKMRIFLSHKGADKEMIRSYSKLLMDMHFDVWLDEDAMPAGTSLHRGIKQGFVDSCAAIFFITPNYVDEGFLETEINYAIEEKMKKKNRFSIITLVYEKDGHSGQVPEMLKTYVWKHPKNDLDAIQEILKALPLELGRPTYRT